MDKLIANITSYFEYLRHECRLQISVHFDEEFVHHIPDKAFSALLPYNSHTNPYCVAVKRNHQNKCLLHQKNIIRSCKEERFCHSCHAGVYELIYPLIADNKPVGYIAVSGFREKNSNLSAISRAIWEKALSEAEVPFRLCNAVIPPLCIMMEKLFSDHCRKGADEYNMIVQFLNEYHNSITLEELCRHFGRSKSHISHLFKKKSEMTLNSYCNNLKLNDAKKLLADTDIPISDIAFDVGFNDVSYFIYLFRKKFGISPLQYRKAQKYI